MKDDNDRLREGTLPENAEDDTEEMPNGDGAGAVSQWDALWRPLDPKTFTERPPNRAWLLDKVLPLGKVGILAAEGGAGKTIALCQLALSVATGVPWLGTFNVHPSAIGRVLLILGEEDHEEVRRRMWNASRSMGLGPSLVAQAERWIVALPLAGVPCAFLEHDARDELADSAFAKWLQGKLAEAGDPWRLIVLDPLSRFAGADAETDNAAATRFIQSVEALSTKTGATAMIAHHTNKVSRGADATPNTASSRGASALTDGARWVATMKSEKLVHGDVQVNERLDRVVTIEITKSNYSKRPAPSTFRHDSDNGGALVACDQSDLEMINEARGHTADAKKRAVLAERRTETHEKNAYTKQIKTALDATKKLATAARADVKALSARLTKEKEPEKRAVIENELAEKRRTLNVHESRLDELASTAMSPKGAGAKSDVDLDRDGLFE
jgi:RecA-family ATPase